MLYNTGRFVVHPHAMVARFPDCGKNTETQDYNLVHCTFSTQCFKC